MTITPIPTFTARSPEDLIALAPIVLGFQPENSLVMLAFGSGPRFHARLDLPPADLVSEACDAVLDPALRHGVRSVAFVIFGDDEMLARRLRTCLHDRFVASGIAVLDIIRFHDQRWYGAGAPRWGTSFDPSGHHFTARAVVDGTVVRGSRQELAALVAHDPGNAARVREVLDQTDPKEALSPQAFAEFLRSLSRPGHPTHVEVARALAGIKHPHLRDAAWGGLTRNECRQMLDAWVVILRWAPTTDPERLGLAAGVTGMLAWRSGDGALAWCAVDRVVEPAQECQLVEMVRQLLTKAVNPSSLTAAGIPL